MMDEATTATGRELAARGAELVLSAFEAYTRAFAEITWRAPGRFSARDWLGARADALERLELYKKHLDPAVEALGRLLGTGISDKSVWTEMKSAFEASVWERVDIELAETFFNSASRRVFKTVGVDAEAEFVATEMPRLSLDAACVMAETYSGAQGTAAALRQILGAYRFAAGWEDLSRDAELAAERLDAHLDGLWGAPGFDTAEMLRPVFFRNKGAYIVGRLRREGRAVPLVLALLNPEGRVVLDAVLPDEDEASVVFSFTRSYFHVDVRNPAALVAFLKTIMPMKPVGELYTALGFNKHGKTELYRDILRHLAATDDKFVFAPGEAGMVMTVFTLPSLDVVFKVIRDVFAHTKTGERKDVIAKYHLVFRHGRAGRLADVQEFEHLEFPVSRFSPDVLEKLLREAPSTVELEGENVVIRHVFTERRLKPLNLYVREAPPEEVRRVILDYGEAIRDMARTNIFPGDLVLKNFGLTRHGRVVFYDYDEIAFLTDVNFRELPSSDDGEGEEPSFYVGENDVFPEEFLTFLGLRGVAHETFVKAHGDLLRPAFWLEAQREVRTGDLLDVYPYPESRRLKRDAREG